MTPDTDDQYVDWDKLFAHYNEDREERQAHYRVLKRVTGWGLTLILIALGFSVAEAVARQMCDCKVSGWWWALHWFQMCGQLATAAMFGKSYATYRSLLQSR